MVYSLLWSESDSEKGWDATDASSSSSWGKPPGNAARAESLVPADGRKSRKTLKVRQVERYQATMD